jgi:hypothetical protein
VGKKYFLLVVDDASCYMWIEVPKTKDEALNFSRKSKHLPRTRSASR